MLRELFFLPLIASWVFTALLFWGESGFANERSLADRRAENDRIQEMLKQSIKANKQPDPEGAPRAIRLVRNTYRAQSKPIYPKVVYREPIRPPFPTGHKRFYGGIPR